MPQLTLEGEITVPWKGVCCELCWTAKQKKCVCRCKGAYHGAGLKQEKKKKQVTEKWKIEKMEDWI